MKTALFAALLLLAACGESSGATRVTPTPAAPGPIGDTWSLDGATWHRAGGTGPNPRYSAAMAYDAQHKVYVMFGGQTAKGTSDETWTWDGKKWQGQLPAHKPPARRGAGMAYDPAHQLVVLYGGLIPDQAEGHAAGDTWTWNGNDWTQVDPGPGPPRQREGPTLVTARDRVILFGGHVFNVAYFGDAWSWDGKTWSRVDNGPRPPGRGNAAVTWDPTDASLIVFGGSGFNATAGIGALGTPLSDAWSLAGGKWTQLDGSGPARLAFANAIWDGAGKRVVVLLGMHCPDPSAAAWAWDGKAWSKLANPGISARWGAALAQEPGGKALLFGGSDERGC